MFINQHLSIDEKLNALHESLEFVLVPGLNDSGPDHWQSIWHARFPNWKRISQSRWSTPDIDGWLSAINRTLDECTRPAILIGHSLGALASYNAAFCHDRRISGVFLVAPAEPMRFELEHRVYPLPLEVPSVVVASHDDPLMTFESAEIWASHWGSDMVDVGFAGHINAEAGFGPWPYGLNVLYRFAEKLAGYCRI